MLSKHEVLGLTSKILDIGESDSYFITTDMSTSKNSFILEIRVHLKGGYGASHGIVDTHFASNYVFAMDWLDKWDTIINKGKDV